MAGPRITMVGSVTGNDNTVGGGGVYPVADLKDLDGLKVRRTLAYDQCWGRICAYKKSPMSVTRLFFCLIRLWLMLWACAGRRA